METVTRRRPADSASAPLCDRYPCHPPAGRYRRRSSCGAPCLACLSFCRARRAGWRRRPGPSTRRESAGVRPPPPRPGQARSGLARADRGHQSPHLPEAADQLAHLLRAAPLHHAICATGSSSMFPAGRSPGHRAISLDLPSSRSSTCSASEPNMGAFEHSRSGPSFGSPGSCEGLRPGAARRRRPARPRPVTTCSNHHQ